MNNPIEEIRAAFHNDDAPRVRALLASNPGLQARINDPIAPFDAPVINCARSRQMLDVLVDAGADLNAKSRWWAGGFGVLHSAPLDVARYAMERGAQVDVHAAARLGLLPELRQLVTSNPATVHERGGDGQTPLHFASTVEIAAFLLESGAEIDARDIDHESTPAQHMVEDRQEIVRFLIKSGCQTDILMAAALGDIPLIKKHLQLNPECIRMRVDNHYFPMANPRAGGIIYQWTLGWHVSAHQVARKFGHDAAYQFLMELSPPDVQLLAACWLGDDATVQRLLSSHPEAARLLAESNGHQLTHAARNNDFNAVRLMLTARLPVDCPGQHHATPLHWAGFHGNREMAQALLAHQPPLEAKDADFQGTPLGWTIHGSEHGWYCREGDYAGTAELLLNAGAQPPEKITGTPAVQAVLKAKLNQKRPQAQ